VAFCFLSVITGEFVLTLKANAPLKIGISRLGDSNMNDFGSVLFIQISWQDK